MVALHVRRRSFLDEDPSEFDAILARYGLSVEHDVRKITICVNVDAELAKRLADELRNELRLNVSVIE